MATLLQSSTIITPHATSAEDLLPLDYSQPGPLADAVQQLPRLSTVCTKCLNTCVGSNCRIKVDVLVARKGDPAQHVGPPYPLAIITTGFLVSSAAYRSYAERLASWGYCVVLYDKQETVNDVLDDVTSVQALRHLINWAGSQPVLRKLADTNRVYLVGHSRGGKLSAMAAAQDPRVAAVCLLDPVDNTRFAPLSPTYPSAVAALQGQGTGAVGPPSRTDGGLPPLATPTSLYAQPGRLRQAEALALAELTARNEGTAQGVGEAACEGGLSSPGIRVEPRRVPLAVVGSGIGGDCAPTDANYHQFYSAAQGPSWEVTLPEAGHFAYVDNPTPLQRAICPGGDDDSTVRLVSQAVMVCWGEVMVKGNRAVRPSIAGAGVSGGAPAGGLLSIDGPALDVVGPTSAKQTATRLPALWMAVESALGIGMSGASAQGRIPRYARGGGAVPAVLEQPAPKPARPPGDGGSVKAVLDALITRVRYEAKGVTIGVQYKGLAM